MIKDEDYLYEFNIEELKSELITRSAHIPGEKRFKLRAWVDAPVREVIINHVDELSHPSFSFFPNKKLGRIGMGKLVKALILRADEMGMDNSRAIWILDDRVDIYEVRDEQILANAGCVAAICNKNKLAEEKKGFTSLMVKSLKEAYKVADGERFSSQPSYAGWMATGFLVEEDVIATAAHCIDSNDLNELRFIFGYKMLDAGTAVTDIPNEQVYKGLKILKSYYNRVGIQPDWALVQLDRKVRGAAAARLSKGEVCLGKPVYVIGHPVGLPLKAAPGAYVCDVNDKCFVANLDVYSGNSGSPVFRSDTGEVIGIAGRGDTDFLSTDNGWISAIYPNFDIKGFGTQCTRVDGFKTL